VNNATILLGNAFHSLQSLAERSVRTCVTSPPYWGLRDYGNDNQLGLESTPQAFVANLCKIFDEVRRVLADDGTAWVNLGDTYADKSLAGVPWLFALAMKERGWYLRQDIIWAKPNPMPESVTDRCTKAHEYIFLFSKQPKYFFDNEAIKEPLAESSIGRVSQDVENQVGSDRAHAGGKNNGPMKAFGDVESGRTKRSVWTVPSASYKEAHFAVYPPALIEPCIKAGSAEGDTVLDPFSGSGTTGEVALKLGRNYVGCELNPEYAKLSERRISEALGMFANVEVKDAGL
jgi:DNA modification methylase